MKMVGIIKLEQIEDSLVKTGDFAKLTSTLGTLDSIRKRAAHTNIEGAMITYEAPSRIKYYLTVLFPILQKYEAILQQSTLSNNTKSSGNPKSTRLKKYLGKKR